MSTFEIVASICMGAGLAAATGFRVFIPLLVAGVAMRFNLGAISTTFSCSHSWLTSPLAIAALFAAAVFEILAYKIPIMDNFLDFIAAPAALIAGGIIGLNFFVPSESPMLVTILGIIAGAGGAGVVHGTTALARITSTKMTLGTANPFFAISEAIGSVATSILAIMLPVLAGIVVAMGLVIAFIAWKQLKRRKMSIPQ